MGATLPQHTAAASCGAVRPAGAQGARAATRRIVRLVRALRKGWIQTTAERAAVQTREQPAYLLWEDDGLVSDKTVNGAWRPYPVGFFGC